MIAPPQQVPYSESSGPITGGTQSEASGLAHGQKPVAGAKAIPAAAAVPAGAGAIANLVKPSAGKAAVPATPPPPPSRKRAASKVATQSTNPQSSIVYEANMKLPRHLLDPKAMQKSRTPAARELMHQIHHHLLTSWRLAQRRVHGAVGFVDSDYVTHRMAGHLPKAYLTHRVAEVKGIPRGVVQALGSKTVVGDVLKLELHELRKRANVKLEEAIQIRRRLLGFVEQGATGKKA